MKTTFSRKTALQPSDISRLLQVRGFVKANLNKNLTINLIAAEFSISPMTLRRHFRLHFRITLYAFILRMRMIKARALIIDNAFALDEIAKAVGYKRYTSFLHAFTKYYNVTPSKLINNRVNIC